MKLRVLTPLRVEVDDDGVLALRAEDASGCFGVQPGHADFVTSLSVSVLSWTRADGSRRHCALRRGVLRVQRGRLVEVATREAVVGDDLDRLEHEVLQRFEADLELQRGQRVEGTRLQLSAIRSIMRHLRPVRAGSGDS